MLKTDATIKNTSDDKVLGKPLQFSLGNEQFMMNLMIFRVMKIKSTEKHFVNDNGKTKTKSNI